MKAICLFVAVCLVPYTTALLMPRAQALSKVSNGHNAPSAVDRSGGAFDVFVEQRDQIQSSLSQQQLAADTGLETVFSVSFYPTANCSAGVQNMQVYLTSCQDNGGTWGNLVFFNNSWVYRFGCSDNQCLNCPYNSTIPTDQCLRENATLSMQVAFGSYAELTLGVRTSDYMSFSEGAAVMCPANHQLTHEIYHRINTVDCLPDNGFGEHWTCNSTAACGSVCGGAESVFTTVEDPSCFNCATFSGTCVAGGPQGTWQTSSCSMGGPIPLGTVCTVTCAAGYSLVGSGSLICVGDVNYLGTASCAVASCPALDAFTLENNHQVAYGCESLPTTSTCNVGCAVGYYAAGGDPAAVANVTAQCDGTGPGTSAWSYALECLPTSTLMSCGSRLMDRLDIFGDPPTVDTNIVLTCGSCATNGTIYGGGQTNLTWWYTFDSDFCTAAKHATGASLTSFDIEVRIDSNLPTEQRIPDFPAVLRYGIQSLAYPTTYPVIFRIKGVHGAGGGGGGALLQSAVQTNTDSDPAVASESAASFKQHHLHQQQQQAGGSHQQQTRARHPQIKHRIQTHKTRKGRNLQPL